MFNFQNNILTHAVLTWKIIKNQSFKQLWYMVKFNLGYMVILVNVPLRKEVPSLENFNFT